MTPQPGSSFLPRAAGPCEVAVTLGRAVIAVMGLLAAYFVLPLGNRGDIAVRAVAAVIGLVVFGAIFVRQLRQIRKARYPVLRAAEASALVATLFIVVMASVHYSLAAATPSSYTEPLSRLDALYFTVTTFATVGYGDIAPTSDATRSVAMVQMVLGVALLGAGIRILLGVARLVAEERRSTQG